MSEKATFEQLCGTATAERLAARGITEPTAVQAQTIPVIAAGTSVAFQSETGTGKTLAYLLPLVRRAGETEGRGPGLLVLAPTSELAAQIKAQVPLAGDARAALLIGGAPLKRQSELLREKPNVVIGGPARLLELFRLKKLRLDGVRAAVLDEADRLLAPELRDETLGLLAALRKDVQLVACSATVTGRTVELLSEAAGAHVETLFLPPEDVLRKRITHLAIFAERRDKIETLRRLLAAEKPAKALVFTSRADQVANITTKLKHHNVECEGLHARRGKQERKAAVDRFRSGKCPVLVTSDLGARGLDIPGITYIVQMDFPGDSDFFIHRAGRTARAGKTGTNVVIGDAREMRRYAALEKRLGITVLPKALYGGKLVSAAADDCNQGE